MINKILSVIIRHLSKTADKKKINGIKKSCEKIKGREILTREQINEIQDYFKGLLGHTVPTEWHQYFYSRTGIYSKKYIPTSE